MHKRFLIPALCCGAAALAGCGSSHGSNSGTGAITGPQNPKVFSTELNALCQEGNAAVRAVGNNPTKRLTVINSYLPKFRALTTTGTQEALYRQLLANVQKEISALQSGNIKGAVAANAANTSLASKLNAPACGAGG
jgi:hypothetical protein